MSHVSTNSLTPSPMSLIPTESTTLSPISLVLTDLPKTYHISLVPTDSPTTSELPEEPSLDQGKRLECIFTLLGDVSDASVFKNVSSAQGTAAP